MKKARTWAHGELHRAAGEPSTKPKVIFLGSPAEAPALAEEARRLMGDEAAVLSMERARRVAPMLWQPRHKWSRFWAPLIRHNVISQPTVQQLLGERASFASVEVAVNGVPLRYPLPPTQR